MFKKILKTILILVFGLVLVRPVLGQGDKINLYFFGSPTCPHCAAEKVFLEKIKQEYPRVEIKSFEITASQENLELFEKIAKEFNTGGYVPFTAVGKYHFVGFRDEETTGKEIREAIECALETGCPDLVGEIINSKPEQLQPQPKYLPEALKLPLIGELETKNLSLPVLTLVIALLDGFNPCAMWVLLFLISLLLGMKDRQRMWLLGITFIAASAGVYFLFLSAWLNLFLFLGFLLWVRIIVGLFALGAGGYHLRDFWKNRKGGCETVGEQKREKIFARIRQTVGKKQLALALLGMVLLAFTINLVELVCSAGLPAVYTQILALTALPRWQYYGYLLFYIFIFMLDDLVIFIIAMISLQAMGVQNKYARWSRLVGGLLMLLIGTLLLFKPEWLTFG